MPGGNQHLCEETFRGCSYVGARRLFPVPVGRWFNHGNVQRWNTRRQTKSYKEKERREDTTFRISPLHLYELVSSGYCHGMQAQIEVKRERLSTKLGFIMMPEVEMASQ